MAQVQAQISFDTIAAKPEYQSAPSEVQRDVALRFFEDNYASKPEYQQAAPEVQEDARQRFFADYKVPDIQPAHSTPYTPPEPVQFQESATPMQGLSNLGGAIGGGLMGAGQALANPQTYQQIGQDIGNAYQTQQQAPANLQGFVEKVVMGTPTGLLPGALQGVRDFGQGILSLPSDIENAYQGRKVSSPRWQLPEVLPDLRAKYPVTSFIGEQLPYAIPITKAAQASKLPQFLKAAAEGAVVGGLVDPRQAGLQGRVGNAALGAAIPTALGAAGSAAGRMLKGRKQPINLSQVEEMVHVQEAQAKLQNRAATQNPKTEPEGTTGQAGIKQQGPKVVGGFVISSKGTREFGQFIVPGLPKGAILFAEGMPGKTGFGYKHIATSPDKLKRIIKAGFVNADGSADIVGFVEHVSTNFNKVIDEGNGKYMLVVEPDIYIEVVKPITEGNQTFYSITTAYPNTPNNITRGLKERGWEVVWEGRQASSQAGLPDGPPSASAAKKTGPTETGARDQTTNSHASTPKSEIKPSRDTMSVNETRQDSVPVRGENSPDNTATRGRAEEEAVSSASTASEAQALREKADRFALARTDSEKNALAAEIYTMAQGKTREDFRRSLEHLPQDIIDDLGRRLGC